MPVMFPLVHKFLQVTYGDAGNQLSFRSKVLNVYKAFALSLLFFYGCLSIFSIYIWSLRRVH